MTDRKIKTSFRKNLLIMTLPIVILAIPIIIGLGESFLLFAVPLIIGILLSVSLAGRLDTKDAIAYPFVQYSFLFLFFYLSWAYPNVGLGQIIVVPVIYIINTVIGYLYFRFVKNKSVFCKILVLIITLIVTSFVYSEQYGPNRSTPVLFRMLSGDFGNSNWTRESLSTDTIQTTADGIFEYQMMRVRRNTPISSSTELWLFVRNISSGDEYNIRLDNVMNENLLSPPSSPSSTSFYWITMHPVDEAGQMYSLTTTSTFATVRRWVLQLNMETQAVSLLEQIQVGMLGRTDDDKFIADLYMINFFDGENRSIRLVMKDAETGATAQIPIDIDASEVVIRNFNHGWNLISPAVWATDEITGRGYVAQQPKRVIEIMTTDVKDMYIVLLREGLILRDRTFELNMNTKTMREIN